MSILPHIRDLKLSIRAIAALAADTPGCIRADLGQPGFAPPGNLWDMVQKHQQHASTMYAPTFGVAPLLESIAQFEAQKISSYINPTTLVTAGGQSGLYAVFSSVLGHGDEVIIPQQAYPPYALIANILGAKVIQCDPLDMGKYVTTKTKLIVLCAPNNPTGSVYTGEELQQVAALAEEHNITILSDDVYDRLHYVGGDVPHIARYIPQQTISLNSASKMLALPGFRVGWLIGPTDLLQPISTVHRSICSCPNTLAQHVVADLLPTCNAYLAEAQEHYKEVTSSLTQVLCQHGWQADAPAGAMYVWARHESMTDGWAYVKNMITEKGISAVPGEAFGQGNTGWVRWAAGALSLDDIQVINQKLS